MESFRTFFRIFRLEIPMESSITKREDFWVHFSWACSQSKIISTFFLFYGFKRCSAIESILFILFTILDWGSVSEIHKLMNCECFRINFIWISFSSDRNGFVFGSLKISWIFGPFPQKTRKINLLFSNSKWKEDPYGRCKHK